MKEMPTIETKRLILRPFNLNDGNEIQRLAGDKSIAEMTLNIPYPYEDGMAEEWIKTHEKEYEEGKILTLAMTHKADKYLIGAVGISMKKEYDNGELGYWVGKPYWNKGYCTEAAQAMLDYGFKEIYLNRIYATHLKKNPASGKVMKKIGMKKEGVLRQHIKKWGRYEDLVYYGLLKSEFIR